MWDANIQQWTLDTLTPTRTLVSSLTPVPCGLNQYSKSVFHFSRSNDWSKSDDGAMTASLSSSRHDVTPWWPDHPMMIETLTQCVVAAVVCCCSPASHSQFITRAHISGVWSLTEYWSSSGPETGKLSECSLSASIARSPVIIYASTSCFVFYVGLREINHMQWWELLYGWRNLPVCWGRNFIVCNHPISNLIIKSQDCRNDNYCLMEKIWLFCLFVSSRICAIWSQKSSRLWARAPPHTDKHRQTI